MKFTVSLARAEAQWKKAQSHFVEDQTAHRSTYRSYRDLRDAASELLRIEIRMQKRKAA